MQIKAFQAFVPVHPHWRFGPGQRRRHRMVKNIHQLARAQIQADLAAFQNAQIKQIVQQTGQPQRFVMDNRGMTALFFRLDG